MLDFYSITVPLIIDLLSDFIQLTNTDTLLLKMPTDLENKHAVPA